MRFLLLAFCMSSGLTAHAGFMVETVIQLDGNYETTPAFALNNVTLRHTITVTDTAAYTNQINVPTGPPLPQPPFGFEVPSGRSDLYGRVGRTTLEISGSPVPGVDGTYQTGELVIRPLSGRLHDVVISPLPPVFVNRDGFATHPDLMSLTPTPFLLNVAPSLTVATPPPSSGDLISPFTVQDVHVWLETPALSFRQIYLYESTIVSSRVIGTATPEPSSLMIFATMAVLGCCYRSRRQSRRPGFNLARTSHHVSARLKPGLH